MIWFYIYLAVAYCVSVYCALTLNDETKQGADKDSYFAASVIAGLMWPVVLVYLLLDLRHYPTD